MVALALSAVLIYRIEDFWQTTFQEGVSEICVCTCPAVDAIARHADAQIHQCLRR